MKKMKKSALAKFIACILMSVAILFFAASFLLIICMFDVYGEKMLEMETLKADIRADEIERIAYNKANEAVYSYYRAVVNSDEYTTDLYRDRYSEDNSNYAFLIEPLEPHKYDLPVLSNYKCDEWQYKDTHVVNFDTYPDTSRFTFYVGAKEYLRTEPLTIRQDVDYNVHEEDITEATTENMKIDVAEEFLYDEGVATTQAATDYNMEMVEQYDLSEQLCEFPIEYYSQYYGIDDFPINQFWLDDDAEHTLHVEDGGIYEGGNYVVSNGIHAWLDDKGRWNYLDMDDNFRTQYNAFFKEMEETYDTWSCEEWYNDVTKSYVVEVTGPATCQLNVTSYVKNDFTAHDSFYYSLILKYGDTVLDYIYVIFGVSAVFTLLLGTFVVISAGYGKKSDEPYASAFDRIPYDILLAVVVIVAIMVIAINPYVGVDMVNAVLLSVWLALAIPVVLLTTAARLKTQTFVSSMACTRIIMFLWRGIKKLGKNILKAVKMLWSSINIYGRYLGVFAAAAFLELIACFSESLGLAVFVIFIEKLIFGAILVIACINLSKLKKAGNEIAAGNMDFEVDTKGMLGAFREHGENLNSIRNGMANAVEESLKSERMKTELITNVSHDIKTPLTSIINYVDLLEKEKLDNEKAGEYIQVLDRQSARLKKLIQDLIDASKASTGNIDVTLEKTDVNVVINQALGEFEDKLAVRSIKTIIKSDKEEYFVIADGRHLWRVMENLINNIVKYALEGSRVYIDVKEQDEYISVTFKNISKEELNISGDELMERFVRGDSSRNTEGSGLGLSIARSLMELQKGKMEIIVDGDLFKVVLLLIVG